MRSILLSLLLTTLSLSATAQEARYSGRTGEAAGQSTKQATAYSMMGWGLLLGVGIATLCALLDTNSSSSSH